MEYSGESSNYCVASVQLSNAGSSLDNLEEFTVGHSQSSEEAVYLLRHASASVTFAEMCMNTVTDFSLFLLI